MEKTYLTTKRSLIGTPIPEQTKTYKPVSHEQLIDLTLNSIATAGFKLDREQYSSAREGNVANGRFTIQNVADTEMQLQIGWQNSYDKTLSLKFAIGTRIFICQNGCVSGDFGAFKKVHRGDVQTFTPAAITEYIKKSGDAFKRMQDEREIMKTITISETARAELIGRMFIEEQFLQSTQLNIIKRELKSPTFDYNCPNSLWELYNYTTFSLKEIHPHDWMNSHVAAHKFFADEAGIVHPKEIEVIVTDISPNQLEMFDEEHNASVMHGVDNVQ